MLLNINVGRGEKLSAVGGKGIWVGSLQLLAIFGIYYKHNAF